MKLNKLTIQGFKSFNKKQVVDFSKFSPGLYFVTGDNQVEPELEANGAGKSTIFIDALCWLFYGKTPLNLKAANIGSWTSNKKCEVELEFNKQWCYVLRRTWNPNKLELKVGDGEFKTRSQEEIEDLIGLGFDSFLYSTVVSQFSSKFFDLDPAQKLSVFSDILDLDKWLIYSDRAKKKVDTVTDSIQKVETETAKIQGQIETLGEQNYSQQIDEWGIEQELYIKTCEKNIDTYKEEQKEKNKEWNGIIELLDDVSARKEEKRQEYTGIKESIEKKEKEIQKVRGFITEQSIMIQSISKDIKKFESVTDSCPYCNQIVSKQHLDDEVKKLDVDLRNRTEQQLKLNVDLDILLEQLGGRKNKKEVLSKELDQIVQDFSTLQLEEQSLTKDIEQIVKDSGETKKNLKESVSKKNPYLGLEEQTETKIKYLKNALGGVEDTLSKLQEDRELYLYWVKGFKEVRLFVVAQALQEFELQINNNLQKLGLFDWSVELAVDKETKSGTIRKGFDVLVTAPHNKESRPFSCWSGGEGQRLRLAGTFGLMDLISSRKGIDWDYEAWDEPTQFLSNQGIDDLVQALADRSEDTGKKIFLIDHKGLDSFGYFKSVLTVVKDREGSRIEL